MAYRRRHGIAARSATFKEEIYHQDDHHHDDNGNDNENGSLAARAIRASAAHRDSAAYGYAYAADPSSSTLSSSSASTSYSHSDSLSHRQPQSPFPSLSNSKGSFHSESTSTKEADESSKYGFWGILAQKGKSILDDIDPTDSPNRMKHQASDTTRGSQGYQSPRQPSEGGSRIDNAKLRKRFDALTSSLNNLGDSIGNAFEEGRSLVENKTADIIQETRKFQIRRRGGNSNAQDQATVVHNTSWQRHVIQPTVSKNQGTQLKASRDVAMATAAKAKVLLQELKAVKAELDFAKQRCAQLEEENKRLRESREKGENPADDDLIRLQLESLLAEKARLANENALHARENRFLREIVEYHRLTMQDFVYLEEGAEEVTEDYPFSIEDTKALSSTPTSPMSPMFFHDVSSLYFPTQIKEHRTEVPKDEPNTMTCSSSSSSSSSSLSSSLSSSSSSLSKPSPLGLQPVRTKASDGPSTLQRVEEAERETSLSTNPSKAGDGDDKRPAVS